MEALVQVADLKPRASDVLMVLAAALAIEAALGDPVSRWHPVAQFGRLVERLFRFAPREGNARQLAYGALATLISVGGATCLAGVGLHLAGTAHPIAGILAGAMLLKASFSYRQLESEALAVAAHLQAGRLPTARVSLRALVGRDTSELSSPLAASAAVESLGENLSDSFIAPLLYYLVFGVPGAVAYRAINTLDAMVGYHGQYEYLGRFAAKIDDLANFVPARVTAAILVLGAALAGAHYRGALLTSVRDHGRTESPNAGWPMATMAGALAVRLEKPGHYRLGESGPEPTERSIRVAVAITRWAVVLTALLALAAAALR